VTGDDRDPNHTESDTHMPNFNKVFLMGNLTRDIELKSTPSNQQVATIGLAVNRRWRTPDGEDREETTFVDCEAWGRTAETLAKYLSKGRPVFLEGRLKLDQWEDKEGKKQSKIRVVVEGFQFIDGPRSGEGGGGGGRGRGEDAAPPRSARPASGGGHVAVSDDDIPF